MFIITATTTDHNGQTIDANRAEVLGDSFGVVFFDEDHAAELAAEISEAMSVMAIVEPARFDVGTIHETIEATDGVDVTVAVQDGAIVVSFSQRADTAALEFSDWEAMEGAVDLGVFGLAHQDSGGQGGPWLNGGIEYSGGTYQRWESAKKAS